MATKTKAQHTAGPFATQEHLGRTEIVGVFDSIGRVGSIVTVWNTSYEEGKANLALHLAAPDLLAACRAVVTWYENSGSADPAPGSVELWVTARAAIARATA